MVFSALPMRRFIALLLLIAGDIALRRYGASQGLSPLAIRMGFSALWAGVIYFVIALMLRSRPRKQIGIVAAVVCIAIELSKLSHTPALDIFRMTALGAAVMGKGFSWLNFAAYAAGLAAALGLDALLGGALRNPFGKKSRGRRR